MLIICQASSSSEQDDEGHHSQYQRRDGDRTGAHAMGSVGADSGMGGAVRCGIRIDLLVLFSMKFWANEMTPVSRTHMMARSPVLMTRSGSGTVSTSLMAPSARAAWMPVRSAGLVVLLRIFMPLG